MNFELRQKKYEALVERYYGKLDLLAAWQERPNPPVNYIRDLKKRLRTHKNDLVYRGVIAPNGEEFLEEGKLTKEGNNNHVV